VWLVRVEEETSDGGGTQLSKRTHDKQVERARARRAAQRAARRRRRNLVIGAVVFVVLVAVGIGAALILSGDDADSAGDDPVPDPTAAATDRPDEVATGPCPTPTDAPQPDTTLQYAAPPPTEGVAGTYRATIDTTCGTIVAELDADAAPQTVASFAFLADEGFYAGVPFHRIQEQFVIQGGDPTGTGTGGPGYTFDDELALAERLVADNDGNYPRGTVAMANSGPNSNGSQFFVVQADGGYPFPPDYAVFGEVVEGMEVVDDIAAGPTTGPNGDEAVDPARILSVDVAPVDE
jgi:cyclophilin family peptidyl-prolyl cis-trans isomerase